MCHHNIIYKTSYIYGVTTLLPFVFRSTKVRRMNTTNPSMSMVVSLRPLAFVSGRELVWRSHTLSCGYTRLEGSLVRSQVQFEDKLQVSGVALASYIAGLCKPCTCTDKKQNQKIERYIRVYTRNPWIASTKYRSMVCANPYFAPNIYTERHYYRFD